MVTSRYLHLHLHGVYLIHLTSNATVQLNCVLCVLCAHMYKMFCATIMNFADLILIFTKSVYPALNIVYGSPARVRVTEPRNLYQYVLQEQIDAQRRVTQPTVDSMLCLCGAKAAREAERFIRLALTPYRAVACTRPARLSFSRS